MLLTDETLPVAYSDESRSEFLSPDLADRSLQGFELDQSGVKVLEGD